MRSNLEGICPKCGARYYGWALNKPLEQKCEKCGVDLEMYRDGLYVGSSHSPVDPGHQAKTSEITKNNVKKDSASPKDYVEKK